MLSKESPNRKKSAMGCCTWASLLLPLLVLPLPMPGVLVANDVDDDIDDDDADDDGHSGEVGSTPSSIVALKNKVVPVEGLIVPGNSADLLARSGSSMIQGRQLSKALTSGPKALKRR
jgi:hypothetical protein